MIWTMVAALHRGYTYSSTLPKRGWVSSSTQCRRWEDVQHSWTHPNWVSDERDVTHHCHSLLTTPTIDNSPACPHPPSPLSFLQALPCIPHISRHKSRDTEPTWPNTNAYGPTPASTPNTDILSPMPACMTSTDLYNPTLACRALIEAKHRHVQPNASERQMVKIGGNTHRHCRGPYHSRGAALFPYVYSICNIVTCL